ncbi:hypothetical protein GCM10023346_17100 [Arthrobacter gyeryongensis]|uniref:Uncharacterized protein n=1 Tax=Arthrobacter gyeryongensis TaxID=1650592 RepID=A0ABP9S9N0_9MICC
MNAVGLALMDFVLIAAAVFGLGIAVVALKRWPGFGLYAVGIITMLAWEFPTLPTLVSVAGFQLKPEDVVSLALVSDLILRPQRFFARTRSYNWLVGITLLCMLSALIGGIFTFGIPTAVNEARTLFWGAILTAWLLNQDWAAEPFQRTFKRWAVLLGLGLVVLFIYHVRTYGFGSADSFVTSTDGVEQTGRPLVSGQAAVLACFGFFMFQGAAPKVRGRTIFLGIIFLIVAVLCQHRSVWAAVGIGVGLILLRLRGVALARVVAVAFYGGSFLVILVLSGALNGMADSLTHSFESMGTFNARVDSWDILVQDSFDRGPWSVLFGEPFGFGSARISGTQVVTFAPHNWYVSVFLRLGLVGLLAFLLMLLIALVPLLRRQDGLVPTIVVIVICAYMWTYSLSWYQVPMLAWAIAFRETPRPERLLIIKKGLEFSPAYGRLSRLARA